MAEKEYIERNAVVNGIRNAIKNYSDDKSEVNKITASIFEIFAKEFESIPAADVAPVRHAKWELIDECINEGVYCSNCHKKIYRARAEYANQKVKSNYCPNCGARMDGDTNAKL